MTATTRPSAIGSRRDVERYLGVLAGSDPGGRLLEVRFARRGGAMGRTFIPARSLGRAAGLIARLAPRTDVYTGVALRVRRAGDRGAVQASHLLFVEIDTADGQDRLGAFGQPPSMLIASGTHGHAHAYWILRRPVGVDELERANRRLAHHLGGDLAAVDAARILRPPQTKNHKHSPPTPVRLLSLQPSRRYELGELADGLPDPPGKVPGARSGPRAVCHPLDRALLAIPTVDYVAQLAGLSATRAGKVCCPFHNLSVGRAGAAGVSPACSPVDASLTNRGGSPVSVSDAASDPLRLVPPPVYFERLTGLRVGRSGKLRCLFHDDRSPSLHVYREPARGWYCFGCGRGGSIYDLAALLSGRGTRGRDFSELRRELEELML